MGRHYSHFCRKFCPRFWHKFHMKMNTVFQAPCDFVSRKQEQPPYTAQNAWVDVSNVCSWIEHWHTWCEMMWHGWSREMHSLQSLVLVWQYSSWIMHLCLMMLVRPSANNDRSLWWESHFQTANSVAGCLGIAWSGLRSTNRGWSIVGQVG